MLQGNPGENGTDMVKPAVLTNLKLIKKKDKDYCRYQLFPNFKVTHPGHVCVSVSYHKTLMVKIEKVLMG